MWNFSWKINKKIAKNHWGIQVHTILVCALYLIKYSILCYSIVAFLQILLIGQHVFEITLFHRGRQWKGMQIYTPVSKTLCETSDLYYKHAMIINYAFRIINKLGASLTDDTRVVIYDLHVFIVQATSPKLIFKIVKYMLLQFYNNNKLD